MRIVLRLKQLNSKGGGGRIGKITLLMQTFVIHLYHNAINITLLIGMDVIFSFL